MKCHAVDCPEEPMFIWQWREGERTLWRYCPAHHESFLRNVSQQHATWWPIDNPTEEEQLDRIALLEKISS